MKDTYTIQYEKFIDHFNIEYKNLYDKYVSDRTKLVDRHLSRRKELAYLASIELLYDDTGLKPSDITKEEMKQLSIYYDTVHAIELNNEAFDELVEFLNDLKTKYK